MKIKGILITFIFILLMGCEQPVEEETLFEDKAPSTLNQDPTEELDQKKIVYKWLSSELPVKLKFDHGYHKDHKDVLRDSYEIWNQAAGKQVLKFGGLTKNASFSKIEDYYNKDKWTFGIYINNQKTNMPANTLAVTQIIAQYSHSDNLSEHYEIVHADIIFNEYDFDFSVQQEPNTYDFQSVLLHELGHLLGIINHSDTKESVMFPKLSMEQVENSLYNKDINDIYNLYGRDVSQRSVKVPTRTPSELVTIIIELKSNGEEVKKIIHQL